MLIVCAELGQHCKWRSINRRACAYATSDQTALKSHFFCMIHGSYVPNLLKIGPYIMSQSSPQTPDGRTFTWFYILSNAYDIIGHFCMFCIFRYLCVTVYIQLFNFRAVSVCLINSVVSCQLSYAWHWTDNKE